MGGIKRIKNVNGIKIILKKLHPTFLLSKLSIFFSLKNEINHYLEFRGREEYIFQRKRYYLS